jgi:hypothetical protein
MLSQSQNDLHQAAEQSGVPIQPGETDFSIACRIVDKRYPELDLNQTAPASQWSGPPGWPSLPPDTLRPEEPTDLSRYRDLFDAKAVPDGRPDSGFFPQWLRPNEAFVGYRNPDGSISRLIIGELLNLSGFVRSDATKQAEVLVVDLSEFTTNDGVFQIMVETYHKMQYQSVEDASEYLRDVLAQYGRLEELSGAVIQLETANKAADRSWATEAAQETPIYDRAEDSDATVHLPRVDPEA